MDAKQQRILVRVVEAAEMLSLGRSKTYALVQAGVIPSIKIGGCVRISVDALHEFLRNQAENNVPEVRRTA
jgi:excisionase family DNA binding protein